MSIKAFIDKLESHIIGISARQVIRFGVQGGSIILALGSSF